LGITNVTTGETREYHLNDFTGTEYTEDKFILWGRAKVESLNPSHEPITKFQAKEFLDGSIVTDEEMWNS